MTQPAAEQCCVCGSPDVTYHNYRNQPFCWPCADCQCGLNPCVRETLYKPEAQPSPVAAEQPRRIPLDELTSDALDQLYADLEAAKHFARTCAKDTEKALKRQRGAKLRADLAETELRTLRTGLRAIGADPTQIQNLWAQIHLRNRQWREEKQRAERAEAALAALKRAHVALAEQAGKDQAAIERVRAFAEELATRGNARTGNEKTLGRRILDALGEQQEQPTTPAVHTGGNAEHCPGCTGTNPPYPFLCPGPKEK